MSGSFDTRALSRYAAGVVLAAAHRAANSSKMNFFFSMDKNFSAYPLLFLLLYAEQAGQPRAVKAWMIESKKFESKRMVRESRYWRAWPLQFLLIISQRRQSHTRLYHLYLPA